MCIRGQFLITGSCPGPRHEPFSTGHAQDQTRHAPTQNSTWAGTHYNAALQKRKRLNVSSCYHREHVAGSIAYVNAVSAINPKRN